MSPGLESTYNRWRDWARGKVLEAAKSTAARDWRVDMLDWEYAHVNEPIGPRDQLVQVQLAVCPYVWLLWREMEDSPVFVADDSAGDARVVPLCHLDTGAVDVAEDVMSLDGVARAIMFPRGVGPRVMDVSGMVDRGIWGWRELRWDFDVAEPMTTFSPTAICLSARVLATGKA